MSADAPDAAGGRRSAPDMRRLARFVAAGGASTALSIVVYQAALFAVGPTTAYAIGYSAGIAFSYYAYARHVFRAAMSLRRLAGFAAFYIVAMLAGSALNAALVVSLGMNARLSVFLVIVLMLPVNYLGSAWTLRGTREALRP